MNAAQAQDPEAGATPAPANVNDVPSRQRMIPSFFFISFVLFMLTNNRGDELAVRNQYQEALESLNFQLANYTAWLNGTNTNFTVSQPVQDNTTVPLVNSLMVFGHELNPSEASYYSNFTGFWKGGLQFCNFTTLFNESSTQSIPPWRHLADQFMASANMTNATEVAERLGGWNWTASNKFTMSISDKLILPQGTNQSVSNDIAIIHGKIDLADPGNGYDELRLEFDGVHFLANGSIYTLAEPSGQFIDLRQVSSIVPEHRMNETARVVEAELASRISKLKDKINSGGLDSGSSDEGWRTRCSFKFFGQVNATKVPQYLMRELEDEIDKPTGISTARPPPLAMEGVLVSRNCGIIYEFKDASGLKSQSLYRKITIYAGVSTVVNLIILVLFSRQMTRSRSAAGLARVSRYPFLVQSLIDAVSFVGHITMAIIADGRPSISVLAPAGIACILFVYEAQFAVLIGQIQAPEDAVTRTPTPAPTTPAPPPPPPASQEDTPDTPNTTPTIAVTPPPPPPAQIPPEPPRSFFRFFIHHVRTDPAAQLWTIMSFCLIVVFRIVVILSLPLLFVGSLYAFMWTSQIYRSIRRGRSSGLHAEYTIGVTLCRLFFLLYFLVCHKNILDVDPRGWVWVVVALMGIQIIVIMLQESLGPTLFLPQRMAKAQTHDYHPSLPLPDPEAPEQSLGDCAICMDAIQVDPSLRQRGEDEKEKLLGLGRWGQAASARKTYSLAPCHHLFHTACLERWLVIKNICPQCRRPLPPL